MAVSDNTEARSQNRAVHRCITLWIGSSFVAVTVSTTVVMYFFFKQTMTNSWSQFFLVLGFVIGSTLVTVGLHSAGHIGKEELDRTTLALAIAAIIFAMWQFRDARMQEVRMEGLSSQLSTKFIGFFPKDLKVINQILSQTRKRLDIMADFVGYGHYSAPRDFDEYLRKLEDLRSTDQLPIRLLVYTREQGASAHDKQFTEQDFQTALASRDPRLVQFANKFNGGSLPSSKQEFDALLFRKQRDYMKDLLDRGVQIRVVDTEFPFFLWNEDDDEAVFAFLNEDLPGAREASFYTRDASLVVDTFKVRFCKYWNAAKEVEITDTGWKAKQINADKTPCKAERSQ